MNRSMILRFSDSESEDHSPWFNCICNWTATGKQREYFAERVEQYLEKIADIYEG